MRTGRIGEKETFASSCERLQRRSLPFNLTGTLCPGEKNLTLDIANFDIRS